MAEILDGTYSIIDGALRVFGGSDFTQQQVLKLNRLKAEVRQMAMSQPNGRVPDEFRDALNEIAPGLGGVWSLVSQGKYGWAFFLFFLTAALTQCGGDGPLIEINNTTQNNYHIEGSQDPHHPGQQEDSGNAYPPGDGTKAKNGKGDGFGNFKLVHKSFFRRKLLSSSALHRV